MAWKSISDSTAEPAAAPDAQHANSGPVAIAELVKAKGAQQALSHLQSLVDAEAKKEQEAAAHKVEDDRRKPIDEHTYEYFNWRLPLARR